MKDFSVNESQDGAVIMGGMLTVDNAVYVRGALIEILSRHRRIKITVSENAVVDLSFLQIACSLHRTAMKEDKIVRRGSFPEDLNSAIVDAGFARVRGCAAGGEDNCLWNIGGNSD